MSQKHLSIVFAASAALMLPLSFFLVMGYAVPEPFFQYQTIDAILYIGVASAAIGFWCTWSLAILGAVATGLLGAKWLCGLLLAVVCIFYLLQCSGGYLYDLENFMLSPVQQQAIGLPSH